jgi:hypothetical protein
MGGLKILNRQYVYMAEESQAVHNSNVEDKQEDDHKELINLSTDFYSHLAMLVGSPPHTMI